LRNVNQQFLCKNIYLKGVGSDRALKIPIAHGEGRYYASDAVLDDLEKNDQVIYRYSDEEGNITAASNHNGAIRNIAGISNKERNVFGMMPHPERACSEAIGNTDGRIILQSLLLSKTPELLNTPAFV
jgi:phosphoribosylformylglycinamidine synthase